MLAFATVRHRWPSLVGTFAALALGVALLTATLSVFAAAQPAVPDRFAGAAVVITSPAANDGTGLFTERVPWSPEQTARLVANLSALPGVTAAIPDRSFYAHVVLEGTPLDGPRASEPLGHAWSVAALAPYDLAAGTAPTTDRELVLDASYGLVPGERVRLLTATGPADYTVSGTVNGSGIYLSDSAVDGLAAGVTVIGLVTAPGTDTESVSVAAAGVVGDTGEVLTGDSRTALEPLAHAHTRWIGGQLLTTMAALAAFATIFVVASTYSLAAHQRRRELALLRAVGATPGQVRRLMLGEALLVGLAAAGAGAMIGALLTPSLGELLVSAELEPPGFAARAAVGPVAGAIAAGLVVCLLGVWAASRRAARVRPLAALRDASVDQRPMTRTRWIGGGLLTAGGLVLAAATTEVNPESAITTAMCSALGLITGLALLAPAFVPAVARVIAYPLEKLVGATGLLVRENAATAVRRTAATTSPILLTVGFAVLVFGMVGTLAPVFGNEAGRQIGAEVVVRPDGTPGLSDAAVAAIDATVGNTGVTASALRSTAYTSAEDGGPAPLDVVGLGATTMSNVGDTVRVQAGSLADLTEPGTMAVTAGAATAYGWELGSTPDLVFADGRRVRLRVVAVCDDQSMPAPVLLPRDLVRAHDPSALTDLGYVSRVDPAQLDPARLDPARLDPARLDPARLDPARLDPARLDTALAGLGARAETAATYAGSDDEDQLVWIFAWIAVGLSIGYTFVAVANTLVMATSGRQREFATLRRSGATRGQVLRLVGAETLLVVGLGAGLGFAVALPALLGMRSAVAELVGYPVALLLPWSGLLAVVAGCAGLALAASLGSAWLVTRPAARA